MNQVTNLRRRGGMEKLDDRFRDKRALFENCPKRSPKVWMAMTPRGRIFTGDAMVNMESERIPRSLQRGLASELQ